MKLLSVLDYLMGRIEVSALSDEQKANMNTLIPRVNALLLELGREAEISSGYRSPEVNARVGGKARSRHMICAAVDLRDWDRKLAGLITEDLLKKHDLYMEHPSKTPQWVHLQCLPPKSGRRIFYP